MNEHDFERHLKTAATTEGLYIPTLTLEQAKKLASVLVNNNNLESLSFADPNSDEVLQELASAISRCKSLKMIAIYSERSFLLLSDGIRRCKTLQYIYLDTLNRHSAAKVLEVFAENKSLRCLNLYKAKTSSEAVSFLAVAIKKVPNLEKVRLDDAEIDFEAVSLVAAALQRTAPFSLYLRTGAIKYKTFAAMAHVLAKPPRGRCLPNLTLDLSGNMTHVEARSIVAAIYQNNLVLKELRFGGQEHHEQHVLSLVLEKGKELQAATQPLLTFLAAQGSKKELAAKNFLNADGDNALRSQLAQMLYKNVLDEYQQLGKKFPWLLDEYKWSKQPTTAKRHRPR